MTYRAMLDHPSFGDRDLSSLRRAVYAMAPMPDELIRRCLDGFGCDFALLFGQTEMSPITTLFRPERQLSHIVPKSVIVAEALPKTSTGKIQKNVLRDQHADHYQAADG